MNSTINKTALYLVRTATGEDVFFTTNYPDQRVKREHQISYDFIDAVYRDDSGAFYVNVAAYNIYADLALARLEKELSFRVERVEKGNILSPARVYVGTKQVLVTRALGGIRPIADGHWPQQFALGDNIALGKMDTVEGPDPEDLWKVGELLAEAKYDMAMAELERIRKTLDEFKEGGSGDAAWMKYTDLSALHYPEASDLVLLAEDNRSLERAVLIARLPEMGKSIIRLRRDMMGLAVGHNGSNIKAVTDRSGRPLTICEVGKI